MSTPYPRLAARTQRFTLGNPRSFTIAPDGSAVWFIRTPDGFARTGLLWQLDIATGRETVLVDPRTLIDDEDLPIEERRRRERSRETGAGVVGYDVDDAGRWICLPLSGQLWIVDLRSPEPRCLPTPSGVIDPRIDPTGRRIAYACRGELRVISVDGTDDRALAGPETSTEVWGQAEFIAGEEMDRYRGFWWAPDGESLLVERYDEAEVDIWHIADPAHPDRPAVEQRYPAAGTPNATVTLWHVDVHGSRQQIQWDRDAFEYLGRVSWTKHADPTIQVLSRDQRTSQILRVAPQSGSTSMLRELHDDAWVELTSTPLVAETGRLITVEDHDGARRLMVDGAPLTDGTWNVRSVVSIRSNGVVLTASKEPTTIQVVSVSWDGSVDELTDSDAIYSAVCRDNVTVIVRSGLDDTRTRTTVNTDVIKHVVASVAEEAPFLPSVEFVTVGEHELRAAVLFPRDHQPGSRRLPVLMDPYGGPHAQRVMTSARMFLESQWLADQGFCVIVADGRGTPGRGPAFEREVLFEFASVTLADQVEALDGVAQLYPDDLDTQRVGITGWSYGGYLAALAVLERPDVFAAAVAGAPVTDWALYDTCYTERYLGDPRQLPDVYARNSLIPRAGALSRPLLLIHGLADDNVVAAHTLRLSSALLEAGRMHTVLPLSGVTHMTPQETVAENLKLLQVEFLKEHLGVTAD